MKLLFIFVSGTIIISFLSAVIATALLRQTQLFLTKTDKENMYHENE